MDKFLFFFNYDSLSKKTKILGLTNREGCYFFALLFSVLIATLISLSTQWIGTIVIIVLCMTLVRAAYTKDKELVKIGYFTFALILIPFVAFMIYITFFWWGRSTFISLFFPILGYYVYGLWIIFCFYHELETEEATKDLYSEKNSTNCGQAPVNCELDKAKNCKTD